MSFSNSPILVADPFGPGIGSLTGAFAGLPAATLQGFLLNAQTALAKLLSGYKEAVVSYGEGAGQKSVTYSRTSEAQLRQHIRELQILLGQQPRRRALLPGFC